MKKTKKIICHVLVFAMLISCFIGDISVSASEVFKTCKNSELSISISAKSEDDEYTFSCNDGCGMVYSFSGTSSISIGAYKRISKTYKLVFNQSGTHSVNVYQNSTYLQNITVDVSENHSVTSWQTTKKPTIFSDGQKEGTCETCGNKIKENIQKKPASVQLSKKSITLKKGKQAQVAIKKKSKGDKVSSWVSSNKKVATVNKKTGIIKAKKKGTAYITVKMKSGCTAKVKVKVK